MTFQQPQTKSELARGIKTVKTYWSKPAFPSVKENLQHILKTQFSRTFPKTAEDLSEFRFTYKSFTVDCYLTKPQKESIDKKVYLTKRNFHSFLNKKPCELPVNFKTQFYEQYGLWLVGRNTIPMVIVNISTADLQSYDQRNASDMRHILFTNQDKIELDILFADNVKTFFAKCVEEYQQNKEAGEPDSSDLEAAEMMELVN